MTTTFKHRYLGKLSVYADEQGLYLDGKRCARMLGFVRWRRALVKSGAVVVHGNPRSWGKSDVWVDTRDLWKLAFYARRKFGREWLAHQLYDWTYDVICTTYKGGRYA